MAATVIRMQAGARWRTWRQAVKMRRALFLLPAGAHTKANGRHARALASKWPPIGIVVVVVAAAAATADTSCAHSRT